MNPLRVGHGASLDITQKTFNGCKTIYKDALTVVFGAPFESRAARENGAPSAIRAESRGMETFSPYLRTDLLDLEINDAGDMDISSLDVIAALDSIESFCGKLFDDGKMPVMIGGEHITACGAVRAAAARWPELAVLHFGSHADLKREHNGEAFSAFTTMRRIWDIVGDGRIYQFGVRSGSKEEFMWAAEHVRMETECANSIDSCAEAVISRPVYITADLGVIDPAELPGAPAPEAGGMTFRSLYDALLSLRGLDVVGFDICGLSPASIDSRISTALAYKLLREMLAAFCCWR
ncbi:MAG: agmatinase [Synergistaceae bacterium]|jgi:agmatinase|nr:agmatinase [Synergistaceae bacterium]